MMKFKNRPCIEGFLAAMVTFQAPERPLISIGLDGAFWDFPCKAEQRLNFFRYKEVRLSYLNAYSGPVRCCQANGSYFHLPDDELVNHCSTQ